MVAIGILVLFGWAFNISVLKYVVFGLAIMKPNTAIGLALGGLGLGLLSREKVSLAIRLCAAALALVLVALGTLTLGEYFFGWSLGIDDILFRKALNSDGSSRAGRMSPSTAFCFVLAGSALWIASQQFFRRFKFSMVSGLSATLIVIGGVACLGQISDALFHFRLWNYFGMAVHTAAGFSLLGSGLLTLARSEGRIGWALDKSITGGFIVAIAIMVTAAGVSWDYTYQLKDASAWVSHTHQVLQEIEDVRAGMKELESSQRGYLILDDEQLLTSREQNKTDIYQTIDNLRRLTSDNPHQKPRLDQLEPLIDKRITFEDQTIVTRRKEGFPVAQQMVATRIGINLSADIERVLKALRDEEDSLLASRDKQSEAVSTATFLLLPVAVFLSLTVLSLALFSLDAGVAERELAERASARLAAIVNSSHDAIVGKDLNSNITSWNPGAERMFGYSAKEMIGQSIRRLIPTDRWQEELQIIERVKQGERMGPFDTLRVAKDGHLVDISVTVSPIEDSSGKIVGASKVARDITERKRLEEEVLLHSQRRLSLALEAAQIGDWELDLLTKVVRRSPRHDQIFGYSGLLPEWNYSMFLKHVHPEDRSRVDRAFQDSVVSGQDWYIECRINRPDHEMRWIFVRGRFFKDESGCFNRLIGLVGDITERKRGEATLQARDDAFRTLAESIPQIVWTTRPDGWNTYFNHHWSEYTGLTQEESRGHGWNIPFHPDDKDRSSDAWEQAVKTGGIYSLEVRLRRADAVYRWWLVRGVPLRNADGEIMQWFGTCTDIHDMKLSEEKTQLINKRIDSMTDEVRDYLVVLLEPDGRVATWNKGAERSTGYKAEEIVGQHFSKFYLPSDVTDHKPELELELASSEGRVEDENWQLRKDGSRFWADVVVTALRDSEGKITGFVKIARDLTARKEAQEKIRQLNSELESRVIERTSELEVANKELEAFSYSVSHDLRAPLRAVDGFSQAVLEDYGPLLPPDGQRYLKTIREGAQQMGTLIDNLLAFSRLSRAPLNKQSVNTDKLVRAVLEDLNSEREGRQIEIQLGELPPCQADAALLKQVWINLLSNAIKYTRQRSPAEIEVGCKAGQENVYFVRDNGAGFDMRYVHKLFGVFQRLHRTDEFEGTGVGLAIVQRIVHRHGGRVWAEAALNHGATFYFTLEEGISS